MHLSTRVLWTAVLVATVVLGVAVAPASAASADSATVTVVNPGDGATSPHDWTMTLGSGASGTVTEIRLNYSGTGTSFTGASPDEVRIAGTKQTVSNVETGSGYYNLTLSSGVALSGGEKVNVNVSGMTNPTATGTYTPNITLVDNGATLNTTSTSFTVVSGGYLNGTVTDDDGNTLSGVRVGAYNMSGTPTSLTSTKTDASGDFSFRGAPGTYGVLITDQNYSLEYRVGLQVKQGSTKTVSIGTTALGGDGKITGRIVDSGGNGVANARVTASATAFSETNSTTTNATGYYNVTVTEGTYELTVKQSNYPRKRVDDVSVTESQTTSGNVTLAEPAYLNGTVTYGGSGVKDVFVVAQRDGTYYVNSTAANGDYNITVPAGNYTVSVFSKGNTSTPAEVSASGGTVTETDFQLLKANIKHTSVDIIDGPGSTSNLDVKAGVVNGLIQVRLDNTSDTDMNALGKPDELEGLGVTSDTRFEINITVTNVTADALMWGLRDAEWETEENQSVTNGTDITIRGKPVTLQAADVQSNGVGPSISGDVNWNAGINSGADIGFNQTVYFGALNLSTMPEKVRTNLNGMSVTTNAQLFSLPGVGNNSIGVQVAAPGSTVNGDDHTGFYQITIPDEQLNEWGVDDPANELDVSAGGTNREYSVQDTTNGARITVDNISYSAPRITVSPDPVESEATDSGGPEPAAASTQVIGQKLRVTFENVAAGGSLAVDLRTTDAMRAAGVRMSRVDLTLARSGDARLEVDTSLTSLPAVPAGDERLFAYEVSTDLTTDDIERATIRLRVERDRVETPGEVTVLRQTDDGWETVPTTLIEERKDELVYEVTTSEFSRFAVVESSQTTATATATPTDTATATATAPATTNPTEAPETATPTDTETAAPAATTADATTEQQTPGFGLAVAVVAVLAAALLARFRR